MGVKVCTGGAGIATGVCVCGCDNYVCKGVREIMHRWYRYSCWGVCVCLHVGALKCAVARLYCR